MTRMIIFNSVAKKIVWLLSEFNRKLHAIHCYLQNELRDVKSLFSTVCQRTSSEDSPYRNWSMDRSPPSQHPADQMRQPVQISQAPCAGISSLAISGPWL